MEKIIDYFVQLQFLPIDQFLPINSIFQKKKEFITSFHGKILQSSHLAKIIAWIMAYGDIMTIEMKMIGSRPLVMKIIKKYKGIEIYLFNKIIHTISIVYISNVKKIEFDLTYIFKNTIFSNYTR